MDSKKVLTLDEAYDAMVDFLDECYKRMQSDDLGDLIGDMYLTIDGRSVDPAALSDWNDSVNKILQQKISIPPLNVIDSKKMLTKEEAYRVMVDYLEEYYQRGLSDDVKALLDGMQLTVDGRSVDPTALSDWDKSVDKILKQHPRVRPMFKLYK